MTKTRKNYLTGFLILLVWLPWLQSGCSPQITPQEAKVLVTLDEIRRGMEAKIDFDRFGRLLVTAKSEIDTLSQKKQPNPCFQRAVERSYASYEIAQKAWKKKLEEKNKARLADMEMALSFSLSFSAINLEKATKCYE
jgi:hypothetical protein